MPNIYVKGQLFKRYCLDTQTHTHRTNCSTWFTNVVCKFLTNGRISFTEHSLLLLRRPLGALSRMPVLLNVFNMLLLPTPAV